MFDTYECQNDRRNVDVQAIHSYNLSLARHRLSADVNQREFQGLTIGLSKENFRQLKSMIRAFVDEVDDSFETKEDKDDVYHLQIAAFKL